MQWNLEAVLGRKYRKLQWWDPLYIRYTVYLSGTEKITCAFTFQGIFNTLLLIKLSFAGLRSGKIKHTLLQVQSPSIGFLSHLYRSWLALTDLQHLWSGMHRSLTERAVTGTCEFGGESLPYNTMLMTIGLQTLISFINHFLTLL